MLTGEGADEALAGYVVQSPSSDPGHRLGPLQPGVWGVERLYHYEFPKAPRGEFRRINALLGGLHAYTLMYHLTSKPRWWLLRDEFRAEIGDETAYDQLQFDTSRIRRWHPLNQSLYMGYKTHLPGLRQSSRRSVAMANSVETRYPFLYKSVIELCCRSIRAGSFTAWVTNISSGWRRDCSCPTLAMRRKAMFRSVRKHFADRYGSVRAAVAVPSLSGERIISPVTT